MAVDQPLSNSRGACCRHPRAVPKQGQSGFDKKPLGIHGQWKSKLRILTYPWKEVTVAAHVSDFNEGS